MAGSILVSTFSSGSACGKPKVMLMRDVALPDAMRLEDLAFE